MSSSSHPCHCVPPISIKSGHRAALGPAPGGVQGQGRRRPLAAGEGCVLYVTWHGIWHGRSILSFLSLFRSCGGRRSHLPAGGGESIPVFSNRHTLSIIPWFNHPSINQSINQSINRVCATRHTIYIHFSFFKPTKRAGGPGHARLCADQHRPGPVDAAAGEWGRRALADQP